MMILAERVDASPAHIDFGRVLGHADAPRNAEAHCRDEVRRIALHLSRRSTNSYTISVFVTPEGVRFAASEGRRAIRNLMARWAHCEVGCYNRRVDHADLLADVLDAAKRIGLIREDDA